MRFPNAAANRAEDRWTELTSWIIHSASTVDLPSCAPFPLPDGPREASIDLDRIQWTLTLATALSATLVGCRSSGGLVSGGNPRESVVDMADRIDRSLPQSEPPSAKEAETANGVAKLVATKTSPKDSQEPSAEEPKPAEQTTVETPPGERPVEPTSLAPLSPLSPAKRIQSRDMPRSYQARLDELQRIGTQLAAAAEGVDAKFLFDIVYNPNRADTCHTESGTILVTTSLLEKLETSGQLAVAVALEMAKQIREVEQKKWVADQKAAVSAKGEGIVVNNQPVETHEARPDEVHRTASELLARAGFSSIDVAAVKRDIDGLAGLGKSRIEKTSAAAAEPKWPGPAQAIAN